MTKLISSWFKIYEEEIGLFVWMTLLLLFIRSSNIVLNNYAETAFLKRFGVEYLPLITATNAIVTFLVFSFLGRSLSRRRGDRLMIRCLLFCGLMVGIFRFTIVLDLAIIYPLLYILKTQLDVLLTFIFWNLANDLFSTRQAKRLFPLITAGGIVGGIASSFGTPVIAQLVSLDNLLLVFPLLAFFGAICAWRLGLITSAISLQVQGEKEPENRSLRQEFSKIGSLIKKSTLAQVLLLLTLLPNIVIPVINYQFSFVVDQTFSSEAGMLEFYSYFRGAQDTISLLLILFVGRIYGRFGLPVALMFHPLNYLVAFMAYLFQFNIFSAVYAGTSVGVIRRTINGPASAALYGLLPEKDRAILRPFLRGTVVRVGILIGSAIVWFSSGTVQPRYLSLLVIVFVLGWLAATLLLKKNYSRILLDLIAEKLPNFYSMNRKDLQQVFRGVDVGPAILRQFHASTGGDTVWYADILRSTGFKQLDSVILKKLPELDNSSRIRLLPFISEQAGEEAMTVLQKIIDPANPQLLIGLAETAKRISKKLDPATEKAIFYKTPDHEAKAFFLNWLGETDRDGLKSLTDLWLASKNPAKRRAAILAIKEQQQFAYSATICHMLEDEEDPAILSLALLTLPVLKVSDQGGLAARFITHHDMNVRLAAIEVLPVDSDAAVKVLIPRLGDTTDDVRNLAISRLAQTEKRLHPLLGDIKDSYSRRVLDGLFKIAKLLEVDDSLLDNFYNSQLRAACQVINIRQRLSTLPATESLELLLIHLEEIRQRRIENVTRALAVSDKSGQLETVLNGLRLGDSRQREDSVEALESLVDLRLTRILLPQLENESSEQRLKAGRQYLSQLQLVKNQQQAIEKLLQDENVVTVVLALEFLVESDAIDQFRPLVQTLTEAQHSYLGSRARQIIHGEEEENNMSPEAILIKVPERIIHLKKIDLFQDLSINELTAIALLADETVFPANSLIIGCEVACRSGASSCDCLHVLINGEVVLEAEEGGQTTHLARWGAGQSFGIAALFDTSQKTTLKVRAIEKSVVMHIYRQDFLVLLKEFPEIAIRICKVLVEWLGGAVDELSRMTREHEQGADTVDQCCTQQGCETDQGEEKK